MPGVIVLNPAIFADPNAQAVHANTTVTTNGSLVLTGFGSKEVSLVVNVTVAPTGVAPTLQYAVVELDPGDQTTVVGPAVLGSVLSAVGTDIITLPLTLTGTIRVSWTVTGVGASFTGVYATVVTKLTSGSVTATNASIGVDGAPAPGSSTQIGGQDAAANLQPAHVHDLDTGVGTDYELGVSVRLPAPGGSVAGGTAANPLRTDPTGTTTQPVSAVALPLPAGAATEATLSTRVADATITARLGPLGQAAMTGSAPVVIASDQSPVPVSDGGGSLTVDGTVTSNQGTAASLAGGWPVKVTDGVNILGSPTHPVRVDPTGTTTQPVSDGGGSLTVDGAVTANVGTTGGLALDATLTSGAQKAIVRGGVKGATVDADVTSTPEGVNHQALDVQIYHAGAAKDPTQIRALTSSDVVTAAQGTAAGLGGAWPVQVTDGANTLPTGDAVSRAIFEKITDGSNTAAVKAASTPAVATDPALVVAISPNNPIIASNPSVGSNNAAIPTSSTQIGGSDGTNLQAARVFDADSGGGTQYVLGAILRKSASGGSVEAGTATNPLRIDPTGTTLQPVSDGGGSLTVDGTVNADIGATGGLALDTTLTGGTAKAIVRGGAKGATTAADVTSTAEGADHQSLDVQIYHGGVAKDPTQIRGLSTADTVSAEVTKWIGSTAPTVGQKTMANSVPVVVASNQSAITITGTVTEASVGSNNAAAPTSSTQVGGSDGTNLQAVRVFDGDTGVGTEYVLGAILRKSASGGTVEAGTATNPLRTDPTGTTAQPVTDNAGSLTVDTPQLPAALVGGRLDENVGAWLGSTAPTVGQKTMANSVPIVVSSDQSAVPVSGTVTANIGTTGGLALDATLTGGTAKAIVRGGTKGATTPADVTSTAEGVDHQSLDVQIYSGGVAKDPTQIRALTGADVVTAAQGTAAALAGAWPVKVTDGTNTLPTGDVAARGIFEKITDGTNTATVKAASTPAVATDPALVVAISPNNSITASNPSVGSNNAADPTSSTQIGGTDGTNLQAAYVFDADSGGGTQYVLGTILRKSASGGSVEAGTSSDPLRIDPTGTTTQPVSDGGGSLTVDGTVTSNQGTAAATAGAWPTKITDGTNVAAVKAASTPAVATDPALVVAISPNNSITASNPSVGSNNAAIPTSSTQIGGSDGTNLQAAHVFDADSGGGTQYVLGAILRKSASGGSVEAGTSSDPLRIDPTGTTAQPVTDNAGSLTVDTPQLPAALVGGRLDENIGAWLGSTAPTVGQKTSANSIPVVVASDQSAITVTGTVTATNPSVGTNNAAAPGSSTQVGGTDGTNLQSAHVFDADTGGGTEYVLGAILRKSASGGSVEAGTASDPIRVDPTGTTIQPVSGTVTANIGTTGGLALDATLTGGTAKAIVRGGTKGATTPADVTSTAEGVDHQGLDVQIYHGGVAKDPTQIRALTNADVVSSEVTKWIGSTAPTVGQKTSANSLPVVIASDQSAVAVSCTVTANQGTAAALAGAWPVQVTDGTNTLPTGDAVSRAIFEKITDGSNTAAVKAASTPAVATDPALVVAISPNNSITASNPSVGSNNAADPTSSTQIGGTDGTNLQAVHVFDADSGGGTQYVLGTILRKSASGGSVEAGTASDPFRIDPTGTTIQPVSGTVTANIGTTGGLALDATLTGGTAKAIVRGGTKGATTPADVTSTAEGVDHQSLDVQIYHGGTAKDPTQIRALTNADVVSAEVTKWIGSTAPTVGQKTMANSLPVVIASDQSAVTVTGTVTATNPSVGSNNAAAPGSSTQIGGTDGTNLQSAHVFDADTGGGTEYVLGAILRKSASGGSVEAGTASDPLRIDPTGTTIQPVSGTVTANIGTTGGLALDATLTGGTAKAIVRGGTKGATTPADVTSTAEGADHQGLDIQIYHGGVAKDPTQIRALTNADVVSSEVTKWIGSTAPTVGQKTMANSLPVAIASDQSAVTVTGTVTATNPSVGSNNAAAPSSSTQIGGTDGTNLQSAHVFDADSGGGTEYVLGAILRKSASGGSVEAGTASDPLRIDPTGTTAQPVTDNAGSLTIDTPQLPAALVGGRLDENVGAWLGSTAPTVGQKTSANSVPVVIASDQSAVPVSGTVTANIGTTGGLALDATLTGGTAKTIVRGGTKGATTPADVTSTAEGVDHQALDVQIYHGGTAKDPTQIRALTSADVVTAAQGTAAALAGAWPVKVTDGTNTLPTGDAVSRAIFEKITDGTNTAAVKAASTAAVAADPALVVALSPNNPITGGIKDVNNSTTATLLASATFTGTFTNCIGYDVIQLYVQSDVSSANPGIIITWDYDGTGAQAFDDSEQQFFYNATGWEYFPVRIRAPFYRVAYNNDITDQTSFGLAAVLKIVAPDATVLPGQGINTQYGWEKPRANLVAGTTASGGGGNATVLLTDADGKIITGPGSSTTANQGTPAALSGAWPVRLPTVEDIFGELVSGQRLGQIQIAFNALAPSSLVTVTTSGTGSTSGPSSGQGSFSTGTGATSQATGVTTNNVAYSPHQELFAAFTASFTTPTSVNSYQRIGLYNATDGFAFGYFATTFGLWTRINSGDVFVAQTSWNGDTCLGGGTSKFKRGGSPEALVKTNINLYRIRFGWLGIAPAIFEILSPDGDWVVVHTVRYPNLGTSLSVSNPNLPITVDVSKTASDATDLVISSGCWVAGTSAPTTPNFVGTGVIPNNGAVVSIPTAGVSALTLTISGSWVGTLAFQYSVDGLNWKTDVVYDQTTGTFISSTTTNKTIEAPIASYRQYRVTSTAWTTGLATILYSTATGTNWTHTQTLLTDGNGTGPAAVKPASTAAVAADPSLVVALSPNTATPLQTDRTTSGTISGTNQVVPISAAGVNQTAFQFAGAWVATIIFEGTVDNITWFPIPAFQVGVGDGTLTAVTSSTLHNGIVRVPSSGFQQVRARSTAFTSGPVTITVEASAESIAPGVVNGFLDSGNSSNTTLGAGVGFVGIFKQTSGYDVIYVTVLSDQVSGSNGLKIQWSYDGALPITTDGEQQFSYAAAVNIPTVYPFRIRAPFYRILYTNGATPQTQFTLATTIKVSPPDSTVLPGQKEGLYEASRATAIGGKDSTSVYRTVKTASDGSVSTGITSPSAGAAGLYAFVSTYGTLRTTGEAAALFNDTFDGSIIDTDNRWDIVTTLGGTVTQSGGTLSITVGSTASASAAASSKPTFPALGLSFQNFGFATKIDAAAITGCHRFWGVGTPGAVFASTTPLTDAIGFEVDIDGLMYACVYASGTAITKQLLTIPTDGLNHRYAVVCRADLVVWYQDSIELPVKTSSYTMPNVFTLPLRVHTVNGAGGPSAPPTMNLFGIGAGDSAPNSIALSDRFYSWRKATIDEEGFIASTALVHGRTDTAARPAATGFDGIDEFTGTYSNGRFVQLVKDADVARAVLNLQRSIELIADLVDTSRPLEFKRSGVSRSISKTVISSATAVLLLDSNTNRRGASIFNDSTQVLFVNCDDVPASSTIFTVRMLPNDYFELPFEYTGVVTGIWVAANGNARITEFFY